MARPTTRDDLLTAAEAGFTKLISLTDSLPDGALEAEFGFEDRDRTVRDVLWHLHGWHLMVIEWHRVGTLEAGVPEVPGRGYTWRTLPGLNHELWEQAQGVTLAEARAALAASHDQVVDLIGSHSNEELFARGVYPWTKSTTLGAYFVSATSSHYDWAMKKLRHHRRTAQSTAPGR